MDTPESLSTPAWCIPLQAFVLCPRRQARYKGQLYPLGQEWHDKKPWVHEPVCPIVACNHILDDCRNKAIILLSLNGPALPDEPPPPEQPIPTELDVMGREPEFPKYGEEFIKQGPSLKNYFSYE